MVTLIQSRPGRPRPPNIHHPRVLPLPSWPRPRPFPLAVAIQSSRFIILPFQSCYKNGIIQYESFWDWLFSHHINSLEIHLVDLDFFFSSRMKSIYPSGHTIPNLNPYAGHRVTLFLGNFNPTDSQTDFRTVQMRLSFFLRAYIPARKTEYWADIFQTLHFHSDKTQCKRYSKVVQFSITRYISASFFDLFKK